MPESTTLIEPAAPPAPPPAPTTELHVDATGAIDKGPVSAPPPKRGSAMDRLNQELRRKAGMEEPPETKPKESPTPAASPIAPAAGEEPPPGEAPDATSKESPAAPPTEKKKVNPWKLIDEHKAARAHLEKELIELKKTLPDPELQKKITAEVENIKKRNAELEEEIRYHNYRKSTEFSEKYEKPYEDAWQKAMHDLGELTVSDATGNERALTPEDILALVNMPIKQARATAIEAFGDFANDVMNHRNKLRDLFDAQNQALEEARKNGAAREETLRKQFQERAEKFNTEIQSVWTEANNEVMSDEKRAAFFKPVEGDEEGNKRLAHGYELADKAFATPNLNDPRLTPEQRKGIVRLHAAIRHRAAGFGRAIYQRDQARAEVERLKAELAKYRSAEPGKGEGVKPATPTGRISARDEVFGALAKYAH